MGPQLRAEVERQLIADLRHYGFGGNRPLLFDWSQSCPEGHVTRCLDGSLENWSGIVVNDDARGFSAEGWLEFIHGGGDNPLFVFWEFLNVCDQGVFREVKSQPGIPLHIWKRIPDRSRLLCSTRGTYDSHWSNDPVVKRYEQSRHT